MLQNTDEWLEFRKGKLGASDANIIMGVSKFMTPLDLYLEKKNLPPRRKITDNEFITSKGHYLEDKFRAILEVETSCNFPPEIRVHEQIEFLMASMDGYNEHWKMGIEIKYVGQEDFNNVEAWEIDQPFPLPQYYPQIQQQYLCSGAKKMALVAVTEQKDENNEQILDEQGKKVYKKVLKPVPLNVEYLRNELIPKMTNFQENYILKDIEPAATDADIIEIKNLEVGKKVTEYKKNKLKIMDLKIKLKPLEVIEKELKTEIFKMEMVTAPKMTCKGLTLTKVEKTGSIDWESAYNSLLSILVRVEVTNRLEPTENIDLANFRKSNSTTYTISVPKPKKEKSEPEIIPEIIPENMIPTEPQTIKPETPKNKLDDWKSMTPEQQSIQAESNAFKTITGKKPSGWDGKTTAERIKYLTAIVNRKNASAPAKQTATELVEKLKAL